MMHARTKIRARAQYNYIIILAILQNRLYKNEKICIFLNEYLHMSEKSSTFALNLEISISRNGSRGIVRHFKENNKHYILTIKIIKLWKNNLLRVGTCQNSCGTE